MRTRFAAVLLLLAGFAAGALTQHSLNAQAPARVFELRTYTAPDGKLGELHARFRNHTLRIFEKHGMTNVIYLSPMDAPAADNQLVYLLSHKSREAAKASWDGVQQRSRVEEGGVGIAGQRPASSAKVESVFLTATDYSPMK